MLKLIRYASIGRQLGGLTERIFDSSIHMGFNCLKARPVNVIQFYIRELSSLSSQLEYWNVGILDIGFIFHVLEK